MYMAQTTTYSAPNSKYHFAPFFIQKKIPRGEKNRFEMAGRFHGDVTRRLCLLSRVLCFLPHRSFPSLAFLITDNANIFVNFVVIVGENRRVSCRHRRLHRRLRRLRRSKEEKKRVPLRFPKSRCSVGDFARSLSTSFQ